MNQFRTIVMNLRVAAVLICVVGLLGCGPASTPGGAQESEFNVANVPAELRDLAPLAKRWGIGDDVQRAEALEHASVEERQALRQTVEEHGAEITRWLDSFGPGAKMPEEAAAFMYMQLAVEELPL